MENAKNIVIFGDSYSTFEGWVPEGYSHYYSPKGARGEDVLRVEDTWWYPLAAELQLHIVRNDSYSGSTVCHTGYDGHDYSKISFVGRVERLAAEGFFKQNEIDTVLVFGTTNDSWANAPLGELRFDVTDRQELYQVLPAVGYLGCRLRELLPKAKIVFIVNDLLKPEIVQAQLETARHVGADCVLLHDVDKKNGHPTVKGMQAIKAQVTETLHT